ncbi:MAG: type II toxin-antitoxin system RelE/ParE family toxin [Luteolibacter sp.]
MEVVYHRLISKDLRAALVYYEGEGGSKLAERFFEEVENVVRAIIRHPAGHHFSDGGLRRLQLRSFPYHILYEIDGSFLWIAVLRHDRRHPDFGLRRIK